MRSTVLGRRRSALVILAALAVAACGGGGGGTGPSGSGTRVPAGFDFGANDPRKATAFGDSITQGELGQRGLRPRILFRVTSANYPNQLQEMLRGLDPAWRVVNRGVGGETTSVGVRRFGGVLAADHPGFVLVMEGTNDAERGEDASTIVGNLESMVSQAEGNHSVPIIGTLPPIFRNDPRGQGTVLAANEQIRALATARRITLAEVFDGMNDRSLFATPEEGVTDPLHPNERGYGVLAGIWFDALQRTVPPTPRPPPPPPPGGGEPPPAERGQRRR